MPIDFQSLETVIRQDPSGRGISSYLQNGQWLAAGMLEHAARDLAERAEAVAIVTGFCVADSEPPVAETDGPPGALYLARALSELGTEVVLISDRFGIPLLELGCELWRLDIKRVEVPIVRQAAEEVIETLMRSALGQRLSHVIAVERVGPSHTINSLAAQPRTGPPPSEFSRQVPPHHFESCHNMRGLSIDHVTAPLHLLFEKGGPRSYKMKTIGIGDGGNEIGMGSIPWEILWVALKGEHAGKIICRVATDFLILAGVSNWGAYALACAVASVCGRDDLIAAWNEKGQRELIECLVSEGGAIDGLTRRRKPTVDGLPLDVYLGVLEQVRRAC